MLPIIGVSLSFTDTFIYKYCLKIIKLCELVLGNINYVTSVMFKIIYRYICIFALQQTLNSVSEVKKWLPSITRDIDFNLKVNPFTNTSTKSACIVTWKVSCITAVLFIYVALLSSGSLGFRNCSSSSSFQHLAMFN